MREKKRKLTFKKIKIANMNTLRGGGETDTLVVLTDDCPTVELGCVGFPGSDIANPCSDGCFVITDLTCPPTDTGFDPSNRC